MAIKIGDKLPNATVFEFFMKKQGVALWVPTNLKWKKS